GPAQGRRPAGAVLVPPHLAAYGRPGRRPRLLRARSHVRGCRHLGAGLPLVAGKGRGGAGAPRSRVRPDRLGSGDAPRPHPALLEIQPGREPEARAGGRAGLRRAAVLRTRLATVARMLPGLPEPVYRTGAAVMPDQ